MHTLKYLALGDSYTIGESVDKDLNFPSQTVALLNSSGIATAPPEIIAKTGWTTDELLSAIKNANLKTKFDIVSLLIGVNNQYRGYEIEKYKEEFLILLNIAIDFAEGKAGNVFVLSIPDWSVTAFAADRDQRKIASEIDGYNRINKSIAESKSVRYLDITENSRLALKDLSLVAADGLHPSAAAYTQWSKMLAALIGKNYE